MDLPPPVLAMYRKQFREVRESVGADLKSVLQHHGSLDKKLGMLLNRVLDWRSRSQQALHEADRFVAAYFGVRTDVQNGGFDQYFFNSAGDEWPDLLQLLVAGNDPVGEAHFRKVLAAFPDSSPSVDQKTRQQQLAQIQQDNEGWDEALNREYYGDIDGECLYPSDATLFQALNTLDDPAYIPDPDDPEFTPG